MKLARDLANAPKNAVIALGNFDGLHLGHRAIIAQTKRIADEKKRPLALMTFEPHPREVLAKNAPPLRIYSLRSKLETIAQLGVESVLLVRFNPAFASLSADDFTQQILRGQLQAAHVVTGENFYFGKGRGGNKQLLEQAAQKGDFGYTALPPVTGADGQMISSSAIRTLLGEGQVKAAGELLGAPYHISGHVVRGQQQGRVLGYPTANIALGTLFRPRFGIYAVRAYVDGKHYAAVASLGVKPTFGEFAPMLEVHLFNEKQDLYGRRMRVEFVEFIRAEEKFASSQALVAQMADDCEKAKIILGLRS